MKTKKQVEQALKESAITVADMGFFDEQPEEDKYILQGWQEALAWVLGSRKKETYKPYSKKEAK